MWGLGLQQTFCEGSQLLSKANKLQWTELPDEKIWIFNGITAAMSPSELCYNLQERSSFLPLQQVVKMFAVKHS